MIDVPTRFQVEKNSEEFSEEDVVWGQSEGGVEEDGGGHSRNSSLVLSEGGEGNAPDESFDEPFDEAQVDMPEERNDFRRPPVPVVYGSMPVQRSSLSWTLSQPVRAPTVGSFGQRSNPLPILTANKENEIEAPPVEEDLAEYASSVPEPPPGFIPPHVYASTYSTYSSRAGSSFLEAYGRGNRDVGSVVVGTGRTLKGKDAIKMRTAVLRQTGFLEPETPSTTKEAPTAKEDEPPLMDAEV